MELDLLHFAFLGLCEVGGGGEEGVLPVHGVGLGELEGGEGEGVLPVHGVGLGDL